MLNGVHILLTYQCLYECEHCFLYCGPHATGTFTSNRLGTLLEQAARTPEVRSVCFEGGEPFLYYSLLLEGVRSASSHGLGVGVVTNAYWAGSVEDAKLSLEPLKAAGLSSLTVSDDAFHGSHEKAELARAAATELGIDCGVIRVESPDGVMYRGRAADRLAGDRPGRERQVFTRCNRENLVDPGRVHVDPFGNVLICQGIGIGNCFERPLAEVMAGYRPEEHPICGRLLEGGPNALAGDLHGRFADECHLCFAARRSMIDKYPDLLVPRSVYGLR